MRFFVIINKIFLFFSTIFFSLVAYASDPSAKAEIARRLLISSTSKTEQPVLHKVTSSVFSFEQGLAKTVKTLAIFGGIALLLFSIQLYFKHRKDPAESPLSTILLLFFIGVGLIILSFVPIHF